MTASSLTARATLELDLRQEAPAGALVALGGRARQFSGWVELASAIESWREDAVADIAAPSQSLQGNGFK